jgi:hypothetical protein
MGEEVITQDVETARDFDLRLLDNVAGKGFCHRDKNK